MFRAVAARLNYLSQYRPEITFATLKLCSKMSQPNGQDLKTMKRVGGFLIGKQRFGACLTGRVIQTPCMPLLTQLWQESDSQGSRSVEA